VKIVPVPYVKAQVLVEAERGARLAHASLSHRDVKWATLDSADVGLRLEDRISRAREYAVWRMAAHDRLEVVTPW
jgi:hypothetical protein